MSIRVSLTLALALVFTLAWALALAPTAASAAPEPCTCEYCLANLDAKCKPPGGTGVASCASLIRSGACLGVQTLAPTAELAALEELLASPACAEPSGPTELTRSGTAAGIG